MKLILLTISLFLLGIPLQTHALTGKVIGVADGDTITILDSSKKQHKIRYEVYWSKDPQFQFKNYAAKLFYALLLFKISHDFMWKEGGR